jgi:signal transduction histidine kinase
VNWLRDLSAPTDQEIDCYLRGILAPVRWVAIIALLLLSFTYPLLGWTGWPAWAVVLLFVAYNLLMELLRKLVPRFASYRTIVLLDLPVVALLYAQGAAPGGPLFVLFLLVVTCAGASLNLRASLLYTAVGVVMVALIAPTLPFWLPTPDQYRQLGVLLIVLALAGICTSLLMQQLAAERRERRSSRAEAERLADLDQLRADFIASISHDLRTPLTASHAGLGMLEASITDRLHPNERQLLGTVRRNIERLDILIDDLLALNQIEAGVLRLERQALDLRTVVTDAIAMVHPLIREKQQTLDVTLPDRLPVHGDARRLEQVVVNLLSNANQHTPLNARISISGLAARTDVMLSVSDTGPGIPTEAQATIFERFQHLDRTTSGSGLGLAIVRGIVELHGGQVWAENADGGGATFHVALPSFSTDLSAQEFGATADRRPTIADC